MTALLVETLAVKVGEEIVKTKYKNRRNNNMFLPYFDLLLKEFVKKSGDVVAYMEKLLISDIEKIIEDE